MNMIPIRYIFITMLLLVIVGCSNQSYARFTHCEADQPCLVGVVDEVVDGDTLVIGDHYIRLSLVNTPERQYQGYTEAWTYTIRTCPVGSEAIVYHDTGQGLDKYGRILGVVYCNQTNLNEALMEEGHAEILTQYCENSSFMYEEWAREACVP